MNRTQLDAGADADRDSVALARAFLAESATAVNGVLHRFWEAKIAAWSGFPPIVRQAFEAYDRLTSDGKKIRAGFVRLGFEACAHPGSPSPPEPESIYRAAGSVEILHNAFLIHDDIVDQSDVRRNQPTAHRRFADAVRARFASPEAALEYGRAVALNFGDEGQALAQELLLSSSFPGDVLLPAIALLGRVTAETVTGQLLDVDDVRIDELTEELVLQIHEYKTAHYTIMLPLQLGAILARADEAVVATIGRFALPLGIAFQVQDDILGLFGDERVLGKPVVSDLREGKKTLLFIHAYERADQAQRARLRAVHGNASLAAGDLEEVRRIVKETGALERSEREARRLVAEAKTQIAGITADPHWRRVLAGLGDYLILRRH